MVDIRAESPEFVVGVDLDGVCGDYTAAFRRVVAAERGIDPDTLGEQRSWDFSEWGIGDDEFHRLHRVAVLEHHMFRTMPVMPGAADALWRLSDAGAWIRLITHRLYVNWGHAVVLEDTATWLDHAGIPYRDICFLGRKPEVEAHVYLDDAPHNIVALRSAGNLAVVFDQPYNREVEGPRVESWDAFANLILDQMTAAGYAIQAPLVALDDGVDRLHRRVRSDSPDA